MFSSILIPIMCALAYGAISIGEIDAKREEKQCEDTDWNEYYKNIK